MVLASERGFIKRLLNEGVKPAVLNWDKSYGKGLDDCIIHKGPFSCKTFDSVEQIEEYYSNYGR